MKKADASDGFVLCLLMNLALHFWWGAAAMILAVLHFWLDIPWIFSWAASMIWSVQALILTALAYWGNKSSQQKDPVKPNKNPYSAKQKELFAAGEQTHSEENQ